MAPKWHHYTIQSASARASGTSLAQHDAIKNRAVRLETWKNTHLLTGSTTSIFVSAIDHDSEEELWASQASNETVGVDSSVAVQEEIRVVAASRCVDRSCCRLHIQSNLLTRSSAFMWRLSGVYGALYGASIWEFRPSGL